MALPGDRAMEIEALGHGVRDHVFGKLGIERTRNAVLAESPEDPQRALEYAGIATSIQNLMTFPFVAERVKAGELELHGAWFAIAHGELHWRNADTGVFEVIEA